MFENGSYLRRRKRYKRPNSDLIKEANKYANLRLYHQAAAAMYLQRKSNHDQLANHIQHRAICQTPIANNTLIDPQYLPLATHLTPIVLPNQLINSATNKILPLINSASPSTALNLPTLTNQTVLNGNLLNETFSSNLQVSKSENSKNKIQSPINLESNLVSRTIETINTLNSLNELQKQTANSINSMQSSNSPVLDTANAIRIPLISLPSTLPNNLSNSNLPINNLPVTTSATNLPNLDSIVNANKLDNPTVQQMLNNNLIINNELNNQFNNHSVNNQLNFSEQKELNENFLNKFVKNDLNKNKCNLANFNNLFTNQANLTTNYSLTATTNYSQTTINQTTKTLFPGVLDLENILNNVQPNLSRSNISSSLQAAASSANNNNLPINSVQSLLMNNHPLLNNDLNKSKSPVPDKAISQITNSTNIPAIKSPSPKSPIITNCTSNTNSLILQDNKYQLYRPF